MQKKDTVFSFSSFSTIIVFVLLMLVGLSFVPNLVIQLLPSRSYASVSVSCSMTGASPDIVETVLSTPLEATLARIKGVSGLSSVSSEGYCRIIVELDRWTDPETFRFEASVLLRQLAEKLPEEASYPTVSLNSVGKGNENNLVLGYIIYGPGNINRVAEVAERYVRPALAETVGIERITIEGRHPEQYVVDTDPSILAQTRIKQTDVKQALQQNLQRSSLGTFANAQQQFPLFLDRSVQTPQELGLFPLYTDSAQGIRLQELARIEKRIMPDRSFYRVNGKEVVRISFFADKEVNTMDLSADIRTRMASVSHSLPDGFYLKQTVDATEYIQTELHKIYWRTGLSIAILLLFVIFITRQFRYIFIVLASLLANILLACICYYLFKIEIHLYSLAGITLSLGLVVDNAIVIVEDLRHTGRNRIFAAILASTLTAIGALSVIFLLEEQQRLLLFDFALTIIVNLLVSLPIAYFFIPALLDRFPVASKPKRQRRTWRQRKVLWWSRLYERQLHFMLRFRVLFLLLAVLAFGLPLFLLPTKIEEEGTFARLYNRTLGSEYYNRTLREPLNKYMGGTLYLFKNAQVQGRRSAEAEQRTKLFVQVEMPKGATLQQIDAVVRNMEAFLSSYTQELEQVESIVENPNSAQMTISFHTAYETTFPYRLKQQLEGRAIEEGAADFSIYGVGRGFSNAVDLDRYDSSIDLLGYNYVALQQLAHVLQDSLLKNPRVDAVLISTMERYAIKPVPIFQARLQDPRYFAAYGAGPSDISSGLQLYASVENSVGQMVENGGGTVDVQLLSHGEDPPALWNLMHAPTAVNDSAMMRFGSLGDIQKVQSAENILRKNQEYLLHVYYRFIGTYQLNRLVQDRIIENFEPRMPFGYRIVSGDSANVWDSGSNTYLWLIPLVLLIIYVICAVLLESFLQPLAVILIIPFSFIGVFLIFYLLELGLDQGSYAAMLMVSALVTNTALYIINDLNYISRNKRNTYRSGIWKYNRAFQAKSIPILVTTASAVLSLLPFMLNGEDQGFWFTLSAGTIGGLVFSVLGAYLFLPLCLIGKNNRTMERKALKEGSAR